MNFYNLHNKEMLKNTQNDPSNKIQNANIRLELPTKETTFQHLTNPLNAINLSHNKNIHPKNTPNLTIKQNTTNPNPNFYNHGNNHPFFNNSANRMALSHPNMNLNRLLPMPRPIPTNVTMKNPMNVTLKNPMNIPMKNPMNISIKNPMNIPIKNPIKNPMNIQIKNPMNIQNSPPKWKNLNPGFSAESGLIKGNPNQNKLSFFPESSVKSVFDLKAKIKRDLVSCGLNFRDNKFVDILVYLVEEKMKSCIKRIADFSKRRLDQLKDYPSAINLTNDPQLNFDKMMEEEVKEFNMKEELLRKRNISQLLRLSGQDKESDSSKVSKIADSLIKRKNEKKKGRRKSLAPPMFKKPKITDNKTISPSEKNSESDPQNKIQSAEIKIKNTKQNIKQNIKETDLNNTKTNFVGKKNFKNELEHEKLSTRRHSQRKLILKDCISFLEEEEAEQKDVGEILFKAYNKLF